MLRTSLRILDAVSFCGERLAEFLSSNAQDFIEERRRSWGRSMRARFLSSNAQDFIEDDGAEVAVSKHRHIPEQ